MSFRDQLKARREACGLTRAALAEQLGVSASAVGNYETGVSFPKEDVLLRLFDALRTDPNQLFCGSYRSGGFDLSGAERLKRRIAELQVLRRQSSELAELTKRYYERNYHRDERYTL